MLGAWFRVESAWCLLLCLHYLLFGGLFFESLSIVDIRILSSIDSTYFGDVMCKLTKLLPHFNSITL